MSPSDRTDSTATPSTSNSRRRDGSRLSRRTFVAAGGTTALVSLAGCTAVMDFLGDLALQDVNIFNGADEPVSGTIEIVDPNGDVVLEETFDLSEEADDDDETNDDATGQFDDVWTDAGGYEVTVELEEDLEDDSDESEADENGEDDSDPDESENGTDDPEDDENGDGDSSESDDDASEDDGDANETDEEDGENDSDSPLDETPIGSSATDTVTIDDPDEEHLVVGIAQEEPEELISFHVIENFSDLGDEFE